LNGVPGSANPGRAVNRLCTPLDSVLGRAPPSWKPTIDAWREGKAGRGVLAHIGARLTAGATIYPAAPLRALESTPRESVRVVILGQDPYHGPGQAEGLAFSVPPGLPSPPSLRNILAELERDLGIRRPSGGHLGGWAAQGVLLLNTVLTVEEGRPGSHAGKGWEALTDRIVYEVAGGQRSCVFMLWGAQAQAKEPLVESAGGRRHLVLRANHPSPLAARRPPAPFIGCGHFGLAVRFLQSLDEDLPAIDWSA